MHLRQTRLALAVAITVASSIMIAPSRAHAAGQTIAWKACPTTLIEQAPELGHRMQCGSLSVPLDHHAPDQGQFDTAVLVIRAQDESRGGGSIYFNPGGPGGDPLESLTDLMNSWTQGSEPETQASLDLQSLTRRFDFVAVVPRGLNSHGIADNLAFACASRPLVEVNDPSDVSDANLANLEVEARNIASACVSRPHARYINSEQTAYDMEAVRAARGDEVIHFLGYSYGTWLGAWYAALFPSRVDRMLLDSSMDWTAPFETAELATAPEQQRQFDLLVVPRALADPDAFGLGRSGAEVLATFTDLQPDVRRALMEIQLDHPAKLTLAHGINKALLANTEKNADALNNWINSHVFSSNSAVNEYAKMFGEELVDALINLESESDNLTTSNEDSVYTAIACNDTPAHVSPTYWNHLRKAYAKAYPVGIGVETAAICATWGGPSAKPPLFTRLSQGPNILMLQTESDDRTPLKGAMNAWQQTKGAKMVVATGISGHGLFGQGVQACLDGIGARFLLTGTRPSESLTQCRP